MYNHRYWKYCMITYELASGLSCNNYNWWETVRRKRSRNSSRSWRRWRKTKNSSPLPPSSSAVRIFRRSLTPRNASFFAGRDSPRQWSTRPSNASERRKKRRQQPPPLLPPLPLLPLLFPLPPSRPPIPKTKMISDTKWHHSQVHKINQV